ncbi:S8 family serine peptidase [Colwelliaceae bacterium BS250]
MNFKLNKIALALPISAFALMVNAGTTALENVGVEATFAKTAKMQALKTKSAEALFGNKYFIILADEPIALYEGGVKGFAATNVKASKHTNVNSKGKLDLKSGTSVIYSNYLALKQNEVFANIKAHIKRDLPLIQSHKIALNALVVELEPHEVVAMRKMPGVLAVQKDSFKQLQTDVGPTHVGAPQVWDNPNLVGTSKGEGLVIGVIDTGIASYKKKFYSAPTDLQKEADFNPSFADIGGDGYDHTNPYGEGVYFGDCIDKPEFCNDKLVGVVSFEGRKSIHMSTRDYRFQTGQDDQGHGTHVASTAAGNVVKEVPYVISQVVAPTSYSPWEQINTMFSSDVSGVAPHANIIAYRTCIPQYGCADSAAILAIEHAMENNVDVLNYSVGGGARSPWYSADSLAFLSAREAGIHVAISAGNSGDGPKTVGSPGNSPWVTTVAAFSHGRDFNDAKTAVFSGGETDLADMIGKGITLALETPAEIVFAGDVEAENYQVNAGGIGFCPKYGLPATYKENNVVGKVVVCRRGGTKGDDNLSRYSKGIEAKRVGAAGLILINTDDTPNTIVPDLHELPTVHLSKTDGDALLAWLATGEGHMASILGESEALTTKAKGDIVAGFSSRGPDFVNADYLVPDVGAPGVAIWASNIGTNMHASNIPKTQKHPGNYMQISGTSMSSPHVAGMYVLMKAAKPEWSAAEAQSAMMMTAYTNVNEVKYQFNEDGSVIRDENGDAVFDLIRANHHAAGSGSARVNLAIEAGLVMDENQAGYLAANPHAPEWAQAEIEGWHGEPHQLNMPSLSKGSCLIECSWTRTFKGVKSSSWDVSFENYNQGFTLTADKMSFSVADGDEVTVNFTAEANSSLADEWVDARIILTPSNSSIPVQTLPVTVNFIAGMAPAAVDIITGRNKDSAPVKGIVTIGTDQMQVAKSGFGKAKIHEFSLSRDATNNYMLADGTMFETDDTTLAIPLNIQADSKRLVIEVLETTSPDLDLYVGIDIDLSGDQTGSPYEMPYVRYMSATGTAFEKIDVVDPINDTYWILVHNWAAGPAALEEHQMVCAEGQAADEGMECVDAAPIYDTVKLAVTEVTYDEDNLMVDIETSVESRAEVETRVKWSEEGMAEGDRYHGVFWLGTTPELNRNIGAVKVNMIRGEDDIKIEAPTVANNTISTRINIAPNNTAEERVYDFSFELAAGVTVESLVLDIATSSAMAMQMAANDIEYTVTGNTLSWSHTQDIESPAATFTLVLNLADVTGITDITPVINSEVSTSDEVIDITSAGGPVFFEGRPVFSATASDVSVKEGDETSISALVVDAVIENPAISYNWLQVSGPAVSLVGSGTNTISFKAPKVKSDSEIVFELVGSNGSKQSAPVAVAMTVENKPSDGGSTGLFILALSALGLVNRRRK